MNRKSFLTLFLATALVVILNVATLVSAETCYMLEAITGPYCGLYVSRVLVDWENHCAVDYIKVGGVYVNNESVDIRYCSVTEITKEVIYKACFPHLSGYCVEVHVIVDHALVGVEAKGKGYFEDSREIIGGITYTEMDLSYCE